MSQPVGMHEITTTVATAAGNLRAVVLSPDADKPLPGIVLVDGSGDSVADDWGEQPATFAGCGAVVLTHDKPGCGGSPGDWRDQTLVDRARESLAALEVLRGQPGVDPDRVGLLGISQGGWVSYLAASLAPAAVRQLVTISGAGVSPAEQERYRIACAVDGDAEALAWVDERTARLLAGENPASILASQRAHADRTWFPLACDVYDDPQLLAFVSRGIGFDPAYVLPAVRCPVFAAFGAADRIVPVRRSVAMLNALLPADSRHAMAVFPRADHYLYTAEPDPELPYARQLATGFLAMLTDWLAAT
jgi:uncharacterized protein